MPTATARYFALIPAAGTGTRMEAAVPKQYLPLAGKPMISHAIRTLASVSLLEKVFVVVNPDDERVHDAMRQADTDGQRIAVLHAGGETRQQTVLNGLHAMRGQVQDSDWILVHDAARPGLTAELVRRLIDAVGPNDCGGLLALPVVDTIKQAQDGLATGTVPRETLWAAQTPQMFQYGLLVQALQGASGVTDEASAIEQLGYRPRLVPGGARNFKVTLPSDIAVAELLMKGHA